MKTKMKTILVSSALLLACACGSQGAAQIKGDEHVEAQALATGETYQLVSVNSGLVLDVVNSSRDNGAPVIQYMVHGGPNQKWRLKAGPNGAFALMNVSSGKCLDVTGQSRDMAAKLQQWDCVDNQPNQMFWFHPSDAGAYNVVNVNSGLVLDVGAQSKAPGAPVVQWNNVNTANQRWWLQPVK